MLQVTGFSNANTDIVTAQNRVIEKINRFIEKGVECTNIRKTNTNFCVLLSVFPKLLPFFWIIFQNYCHKFGIEANLPAKYKNKKLPKSKQIGLGSTFTKR